MSNEKTTVQRRPPAAGRTSGGEIATFDDVVKAHVDRVGELCGGWSVVRKGTIWWSPHLEPHLIDLANPPMTGGAVVVLIDAGSWVLVKAAAVVADTPLCRTFLSSAKAVGLLATEMGRLEQSGRQDFKCHAAAVNPAALCSKKLLAKFAAAVFEEEVPRMLVAIYCDGARIKGATEETAQMILRSQPGWGVFLLGAAKSVMELADRFPRMESEIQKIQYRREDVADRQDQLEAQAAAMRDSKNVKNAKRDEWIVGRYARERSKHQAGEYGNVPTMEAVVDQWNRAGIGRQIANVKTVRRILKAHGIDPAAPNATP